MIDALLLVIVVVVAGLWALPDGYNTETFPHPAECWDCKRGNCKGCMVNEGR